MTKKLIWHEDWFEDISDFYSQISSIKRFAIPGDENANKKTLYRLDESLTDIKLAVDLIITDSEIPHDERQNVKLNYYFNSLEKQVEDSGSTLIPTKDLTSLAIQKLNNFEDQIKREEVQVKNLVIINLVSSIEMIINKILEYNLLYIYKNSSIISKKTITFENLSNFSSIREIQKHLTETFIRDLSYKNFTDLITEVLKICDTEKARKHPLTNKRVETVNELCQRRHMIAHNNGVANTLYFSKTNPDYIDENIVLNDKIDNTIEYLDKTCINVLNLGMELIARNFYSKKILDDPDFEDKITSLGLTMMNQGDYEAARILFYYVHKYNVKYKSDNHNHCFNSKFNYWLTFKLEDKLDERQTEVENYQEIIDSSIKDSKMIKLGFSALLEPKESFQKKAIAFLSEDENQAYIINMIDWPIFKIVEKEDEYVEFLNRLF